MAPTLTRAADGVAQSLPPAPVSHDEIAAQAYAIYLSRGRQEGLALQDWLDAEAVLIEGRLPTTGPDEGDA
jgi:hypothetical protein